MEDLDPVSNEDVEDIKEEEESLESKSDEEVEDVLDTIEKYADALIEARGNPLLVLYYSNYCGQILGRDVERLAAELEELDADELDVIIHTHGGRVSASYMLAQNIREKCNKMNLLVPNYSYSGGTLIALAADTIEMHPTSKLSPIDVQLQAEEEENSFSLINFDKYIEFIGDVTEDFELDNEENRAEIISQIMIKMSEEFHPLQIGNIYRLNKLREVYARKLILSYMYPNHPNNKKKADKIIDNLTLEAPMHDFDIDKNLAKDYGLPVEDMGSGTYNLSSTLIQACKQGEKKGAICNYIDSDHEMKMPFIELYKE